MNMKAVNIDKCAVCGKNRVLYSSFGIKTDDKIYTLNSEKPCCQNCFEKEVKKQLKDGVLHV
jgi:ribosomal protein L37AE/L43A